MTKKSLPFKLEFSSTEKVTPYAGLGIYGGMYKSVGIKKDVDHLLPQPGSGSGYESNMYIYPLTMMFIGGGKYIEDIGKIEADEGLREICRMETVPSSDAIGGWLKRRSEEKIHGIGQVNDEITRKLIRNVGDEDITLDIDAMGIEADKYEAAYTYKGYKGYMPMLGFIPEVGCCVGYEFREGNVPPCARNYEFTKAIFEKVKSWGKQIRYFRSDSAGYQARVVNYVHNAGGKYTITVGQDEAVKRGIQQISESEWKIVRDKSGIRTGREYAEFVHSMNESDHAFRVVVQRWLNPQRDLLEKTEEYCYHGIGTNMLKDEKNGEEIIWWHNKRSNSENYNKEVKDGFNLAYVPCGEFGANAVWFGIGILAYNLFIASKVFLFPKSWIKKTIGTIRWQFIQMAGKVLRRARMLVLKICSTMRETYEIYTRAEKRCDELYFES